MRDSGLEPPVSEAELHGFVDGGLDRARSDAVQAFLAASPADTARVETWRRQNEKICAAFASMKSMPLPWSLPFEPGAEVAAATEHAARASGQGGARGRFQTWRERWSARLIMLAFVSGVLLTAGADYLADRVSSPESEPISSKAFAAQTNAALQAFGQPQASARLSPNEDKSAQELAAPILPNLPVNGFKLAGVRAMQGEQGQMLCMFYTRPESGNLAFCAEKTPGPSEAVARLTGSSPSAAMIWRQNGANYALTGALPEPELRALAGAVRAEVAAFGGKQTRREN